MCRKDLQKLYLLKDKELLALLPTDYTGSVVQVIDHKLRDNTRHRDLSAYYLEQSRLSQIPDSAA